MATVTYPFDEQRKAPAFSLPSLLHEWVVTVDHKKLGLMYTITALLFFVVAGLLAGVMRAQLAVSEQHPD